MGFSDLLTSSRGPGVIGTLLALLVLVGFGTLYLFVFDEGLQGGQKTIQAVIRDQDLEIESSRIQIENARKRLAEAEVAKAQGREAEELKSRVGGLAKQIEELNGTKTAAEEAVRSAMAAWEQYKDEYRASEWASAVGDKMADITTPSGEVFTNVEVKAVDHTGVRISHSAGSRTIAPEDLPADLFDRFQFDLAKKAEIKKKEDNDFEDHSNNVEVANLAKSGQEKLLRIERLREEIVTLSSQIEQAKVAVHRNQAAVDRKRIDIANERAKKGGISRAPQMQEELRIMERTARENRDSIPTSENKIRSAKREISTLESEVREIKGKIAGIKKAEDEKKAAAVPQP